MCVKSSKVIDLKRSFFAASKLASSNGPAHRYFLAAGTMLSVMDVPPPKISGRKAAPASPQTPPKGEERPKVNLKTPHDSFRSRSRSIMNRRQDNVGLRCSACLRKRKDVGSRKVVKFVKLKCRFCGTSMGERTPNGRCKLGGHRKGRSKPVDDLRKELNDVDQACCSLVARGNKTKGKSEPANDLRVWSVDIKTKEDTLAAKAGYTPTRLGVRRTLLSDGVLHS